MTTPKFILLTLIFVSITCVLSAQSTLNISSHSATLKGVVHDFSIGEMTMVTTEQTENLLVTQGLLQPSPFSNKKNNDHVHSDFIDFVKVYPNPTSHLLFIELIEVEHANIRLYDALGKLLVDTKSNEQRSSLDVSSFALGTYYLIISDPKQPTLNMSFNIQKIK